MDIENVIQPFSDLKVNDDTGITSIILFSVAKNCCFISGDDF